MQMNLASAAETKYLWAFARDSRPPARRYRPALQPRAHQDRYVITACSKQASAFGVTKGMSYADAHKLVPNIRVIVINR